MVLVTIMYLRADAMLRALGYDGVEADAAMIFINRLVDLVVYLTATVAAWWFGDRTIHKRLERGVG